MHEILPTAPLEEVTTYHENGQVAERGFRQQNQWHGEWLQVDEEGTPQCRLQFVHGQLDGESQVFDGQGQVRVKVQYRKGVRHGVMMVMQQGLVQFSAGYINGKQEGAARTFSNQGVLMSEIDYGAGVRHGVARWFDEAGRLVKRAYYRDNQLDGEMEEYDPHGHVITRALYRADQLDGVFQRMDKEGTVIEERVYRHGQVAGDPVILPAQGGQAPSRGTAQDKGESCQRKPWWKTWMPVPGS